MQARGKFFDYCGIFLSLAIIGVGSGMILRTVFAGTTSTSTVTAVEGAGNSAPSVPAVALNAGDIIVLVENGTKTVNVAFTVSDNDGCSDVFTNGTTSVTVFRNGTNVLTNRTCGIRDNINRCYTARPVSNNCSAGISANATASVDLYYLADATDASSSFPNEHWEAIVLATDAASATGTASSTAVELQSIMGLALTTSSINYGSVDAGSDTSSTNQIAGIYSTGNVGTTLRLSGTALVSSGNTISTSSQHYATTTFTYGGNEQALQETPTNVTGSSTRRQALGPWPQTTAISAAVRRHGVASKNFKIYTTGGVTGVNAPIATVYRGTINSANGTVTGWDTTTALPSTLKQHATVIYNSYIYAAGGISASSGAATTTVFFAPVNSNGSIGTWGRTTVLPTPTLDHALVAYKDFMYVIGGNSATTNGGTSTVFYAQINATGSLGSWNTTTALPNPLRLHKGAAYNNYLYVAGGTMSGSNASTTSAVWYASINSNGTVNSWNSATPLISPLYGHGMALENGLLYVTGGVTNSGSVTSTTAFAPIHSGGDVGLWSTTFTPADPVTLHGVTSYNGYIYNTGGSIDVNNSTSTVTVSQTNGRNTYWGLAAPGGTVSGTYTGTNNFFPVFTFD